MDLTHALSTQPRPCGSNGSRPWFCLKTKPQQEAIAFSELRNQDFPAFLPLKADAKGFGPLFPSYIFAQPLENGHWAPMRYTRGVADILMSGPSRPAVVPAGAMLELFRRLSDDGILWPEPSRQVNEGTRFQVEDGPFAGFIASCTRASHDRVYALLTVMGRATEVPFPRNTVKAVQKESA